MSDVPDIEPVNGGDGGQNDETVIAHFREEFAGKAYHLLEPVHPIVNYSFEVMPADPWTLELCADKWWIAEDGRIGHDTLTLNSYQRDDDEVQRETVREEAMLEREELLRLHQSQGLDAAMQRAEEMAVANGYLDANRDDPRMFTQGPADTFSLGEYAIEIPVEYLEDTPQNLWEMQVVSVQTADAELLGASVMYVEYPEFWEPANPDDKLNAEEARLLEIAQFHTEQDAEYYKQEYLNYWQYGYDGDPQILAEEVAKNNGLPETWIELQGDDLAALHSGEHTVTHKGDNWQPKEYTPDRWYGVNIDNDISR